PASPARASSCSTRCLPATSSSSPIRRGCANTTPSARSAMPRATTPWTASPASPLCRCRRAPQHSSRPRRSGRSTGAARPTSWTGGCTHDPSRLEDRKEADMPDYLAPGVYTEEYDSTPSIEGVSTSIAGFVGATQRGPTTGLPVLITNPLDFQRRFGGPFDFGPSWAGFDELPYAVAGVFAHQVQLLYGTRVIHGAHLAQAQL